MPATLSQRVSAAPCAARLSGSARRCLPKGRQHGLSVVARGGGGGLILPGDDEFPDSEIIRTQPGPPGLGRGGPAAPGRGPQIGGFRPPPSNGFGPVEPRQVDGPLYQPFRPPAAFEETAKLSKDELLRRVRERRGYWFDLGKALDALYAKGVQNTEIEEIANLSRVEQSVIKIAAVVYDGISSDKDFPQEKLDFFKPDMRAEALSELRVVPDEYRTDAAIFVVDNDLDAKGSRELAKAYLDRANRQVLSTQSQQFDNTAGDTLAFKIWRDAMEVQRRPGWEAIAQKIIDRGLKYATSDNARTMLRGVLIDEEEAVAVQQAKAEATVQTIELESDEAAYRPIPLIGSIDEVSPKMIRLAPVAQCAGVFNAFRPIGNCEWVALPNWYKVQDVKEPVVISVANTATLTVSPTLSAVLGPALLVIDRNDLQPNAENFYIVARSSSLVDASGRGKVEKVELLDGTAAKRDAKNVTVCGRVLFACRPPPKKEDANVGALGAGGQAIPELGASEEAGFGEED